MSELTDDEFTCLEIASHGESMMAIGRWASPLKSLVKKGMMDPRDGFNYVITGKGREALGGHKQEVDTDWAQSFIKVNNQRYFDRTQKNQPSGVYVVQGTLFFKLLDGTTLNCTCIKEPYASKIVELFNGRNANQERPGQELVQGSPRPAISHSTADESAGDEQPKSDEVC